MQFPKYSNMETCPDCGLNYYGGGHGCPGEPNPMTEAEALTLCADALRDVGKAFNGVYEPTDPKYRALSKLNVALAEARRAVTP